MVRAETTCGAISRVFPDLSDDLLLNLFHKGARAQWTSRDLDWAPPTRLNARQRLALARLLTPVYFGEQTAMAGASSILPQVMAAGETTAQLYLASFIMDEARHFETLTRLYRALGHDPLGLREIPELLRYHHRIRQGDRADWVWGILFSDVIAKHFYRAFGAGRSRDPLFGEPVDAHSAGRVAPPGVRRALPAAQRRDDGARAPPGAGRHARRPVSDCCKR